MGVERHYLFRYQPESAPTGGQRRFSLTLPVQAAPKCDWTSRRIGGLPGAACFTMSKSAGLQSPGRLAVAVQVERTAAASDRRSVAMPKGVGIRARAGFRLRHGHGRRVRGQTLGLPVGTVPGRLGQGSDPPCPAARRSAQGRSAGPSPAPALRNFTWGRCGGNRAGSHRRGATLRAVGRRLTAVPLAPRNPSPLGEPRPRRTVRCCSATLPTM